MAVRRRRTRVSATLAIFGALAATGCAQQELSGTVIDSGDGPQLCGRVMESYPPQCGEPTAIDGWDWDAVEHEASGGVRWGDYRFEAVLEDERLSVVGAVELRERG